MLEAVKQLFITNLSLRVSSLRKAKETNDWKEMELLGHQMKSAAPGYGYPTLGLIAAEIEGAARARRDIEGLFFSYEAECSLIISGEKSSEWDTTPMGMFCSFEDFTQGESP